MNAEVSKRYENLNSGLVTAIQRRASGTCSSPFNLADVIGPVLTSI